MYMEALSGENGEEYFKATDDEFQYLIRRDTWEIVSSKSVADNNVLPGTWYFRRKRKPDRKTRKFNVLYCVRGGVQKILSPEHLNSYYPVVQWVKVRLMFILQCILGLLSQSIDF